MSSSPAGWLPSLPPIRLTWAEQRRCRAEQHLRNHAALHGLSVSAALQAAGHTPPSLAEASTRMLYGAEAYLRERTCQRDLRVNQQQAGLGGAAAAQQHLSELLR